jgi:branched-chain amino acid transport system permease protein
MAWVNAVIQGVLVGGLYALFACGLSLMFGVMKVVNLAHGDLAVLAGYFAIGIIALHIPVLLDEARPRSLRALPRRG